MKPLISIAMATYNGEKYLKEQLDSIYDQTYKNIEVIVVDDASNDNTATILERYKKKYGLEYVVNVINLGVTKNFEKSISMCKGEYIALVDQDDVWLPHKIETLLNNINGYSLIYSNGKIINGDGDEKGITTAQYYPLYGVSSKDIDIFNYLVLNSFILGCSVLFKRELLYSFFTIFPTDRNHDWWLSVCAKNNKGIKYIDEILFHYRHHDNNISRKGERLSLYQKVTLNFSEVRRVERANKIKSLRKVVLFLLKQNIYSNEKELHFLKNTIRFTDSILNTKIHFFALFFSIKYRKYMFLSKSIIENILHVFSRLIS